MPTIAKANVLIIATHGFEQSELEFPRDQLRAKGATVDIATLDGEPATGWDGVDWGREAPADLRIADADPTRYDALVLPGGQINPDLLRVEPEVIALIRAFDSAGKPLAAICHAPWLLAEAELCGGREMTSYPSIKTDIDNAGAKWMDAAVVQDRNIITSRKPGDLEAFVGKIVEDIETGVPGARAA